MITNNIAKILLILLLLIGISFHLEAQSEQNSVESDESLRFIQSLGEMVREERISADAGWEVFSCLAAGELRDKILVYINMLANYQMSDSNLKGFKANIDGPFVRDCSQVLKLDRAELIKEFAIKTDANITSIDVKKIFLGLGEK